LAAITNVATTGVVRKGNAGKEEAGAICIPGMPCAEKEERAKKNQNRSEKKQCDH
jgi:hypothetical protein